MMSSSFNNGDKKFFCTLFPIQSFPDTDISLQHILQIKATSRELKNKSIQIAIKQVKRNLSQFTKSILNGIFLLIIAALIALPMAMIGVLKGLLILVPMVPGCIGLVRILPLFVFWAVPLRILAAAVQTPKAAFSPSCTIQLFFGNCLGGGSVEVVDWPWAFACLSPNARNGSGGYDMFVTSWTAIRSELSGMIAQKYAVNEKELQIQECPTHIWQISLRKPLNDIINFSCDAYLEVTHNSWNSPVRPTVKIEGQVQRIGKQWYVIGSPWKMKC